MKTHVIWPKSYEEFDKYCIEARDRGMELFDVNRNPFFPTRKTGKYDINTGRGYVGIVAINQEERYYYILDFGKIKTKEYENEGI